MWRVASIHFLPLRFHPEQEITMHQFAKTDTLPTAKPASAKIETQPRAWAIRPLPEAGSLPEEQLRQRATLVRAAMQCAASDT